MYDVMASLLRINYYESTHVSCVSYFPTPPHSMVYHNISGVTMMYLEGRGGGGGGGGGE